MKTIGDEIINAGEGIREPIISYHGETKPSLQVSYALPRKYRKALGCNYGEQKSHIGDRGCTLFLHKISHPLCKTHELSNTRIF